MRTKLIVGFMAVIAATGCKTTVDHAEVEKSIQTAMAEKKLTLTRVTCPAEIVRKEGDSFNCTAVDDAGTEGTVKVTWKEGGNFTMVPEGVMTLSSAGDAAESGLGVNIGKKVDVKCPEKAMFLKAGKKFTCDATVEGLGNIAHKVDFTLKDDKGGLDMNLHPASEAAKLERRRGWREPTRDQRFLPSRARRGGISFKSSRAKNPRGETLRASSSPALAWRCTPQTAA